MDHEEARRRLLDAADALFYERGIQVVGMDEIRARSGVSLRRLYQCFASKDSLIEAYLRRRDERWRAALADYVTRHAAGATDRPLAVFDWLAEWFAEPGFRGCAFINSLGELGAVSPGVAGAVRQHKQAVNDYLETLLHELPVSDASRLARQLLMLADGAITSVATTGDAASARLARAAAEALVTSATNP